MNLQECCEVLEKISQTSSKNDKIQILKDNDCTSLRELLSIALNPYDHYGVIDFDDGRVYRGDIPKIDETVSLKTQLLSGLITGHTARDAVRKTILCYNKLVRKWLVRIFKKDLKAGIAIKTVNKAFPKLIPEFTIALCDTYEDSGKLPEGDWIAEPKLDGLRCITIIDNSNKITFLSRAGKQLYNLELIEEKIKTLNLKAVVLDGELYSNNWNDTISITHTQEEHKDKNKLTYYIFDIVPYIEWVQKKSTESLEIRKLKFNNIFKEKLDYVKLVKHAEISNFKEMQLVHKEYIERGYEGIVLKKLNSYYPFKRSKSWLKYKLTETYDIRITGFLPGTGKHKGKLGAFICEFEEKCVKVGSGFTDDQREKFWGNKNEMVGKVVEVQCQEKTKDGSLRFPVFVRIREDK